MNRFESELKSHRGVLNGRRWNVQRHYLTPCEVSELRPSAHGGFRYFPGHWAGKIDRGFHALEMAGSMRREAVARHYRGSLMAESLDYLNLSRRKRLSAAS